MTDTSHLAALETRLSHERAYLAKSTKPAERAVREVWIMQIEREIASEIAFLAKRGLIVDRTNTTDDISDADLLALLTE